MNKINERLKNIEKLEWSTSYKEGKVEFSFSEELITDYYKLYQLNENWEPLPINRVIFLRQVVIIEQVIWMYQSIWMERYFTLKLKR